jgi:PAS domain S-box-containing protein
MIKKTSDSKGSAQADSSPRHPASRRFGDAGGSGGRTEEELRRRAEKEARVDEAKIREPLSPEEARQALHELRVHQIELDMQNEELRRAQEALEALRARYFDLYDLAPVGYFVLNQRGLILEANLTAATLLGEARGALVKEPISRLILKEDQGIYYRHRKQLFETGEPQACELRLVKKDGAAFWALLEARAAQDAEGAPVCRVALSDITERKRAEETLHESEEQLRAIMENAPDGVYLNDLAGNFLYGNRKTEEITGFRREEIIGKNMMELNLLSPDGLAKAVGLLQDNSRGKSTGPDELRLNQKDGSPIIVEINTSVARRRGRPVVIGFVRDITQRKQAEEALRQSEEQLRLALNAAHAVAWMGELKSNALTEIGPVAEVFGTPPGFRHASLASFLQDIHPDDRARVLAALQGGAQGGADEYTLEFRVSLADGGVRWLQASGRFERDPNGLPTHERGITLDITERKQAEGVIKSQLEELQRWQDVMLGREDRVQELKREVNELCLRMGEAARYPSQEAGPEGPEAGGSDP